MRVIQFTLGFSNAFLIKDRGCVFVDTGTEESRQRYVDLFSRSRVDPKEVNLIIISHGHADHFVNIPVLKELTDAPVLCHHNAVYALQHGQKPHVIPRNEVGEEALKLVMANDPLGNRTIEPVQPDIVIDAPFDLNEYGVGGRIVHTPGHSNSCVSVILDSGEAIVGDMVLESPLSGELVLAIFAEDEKALFANMRMLLTQAHTLYSGHGGPFKREDVLRLL